jgi:hypothetical protein
VTKTVEIDEDISLPTQKTLATLSVIDDASSLMRRRASGDTIYYSLSDGTIKATEEIPSVPVATAVSPSKNDVQMQDQLPESPINRRLSNISKENLECLASSSAAHLHELIHQSASCSPAGQAKTTHIDAADSVITNTTNLSPFDASVMTTSTPVKSGHDDMLSPASKPSFSSRDFESLKQELEERVPISVDFFIMPLSVGRETDRVFAV